MTRVVFLTHNFPRYSGDISGAFLATLARGLMNRGVSVRVVAPSDGGDVGQPQLDGIPVRRVRYATPERENIAYRGTMADVVRSISGWRTLLGLYRALRSAAMEEVAEGADLIHAHWWVPAGLAAPTKSPMLLTIHGTDAALLERSPLARAVARPVIRRARVVTAVSTSHAARIKAATGRAVEHVQAMPVTVPDVGPSQGGGGLVVVARLIPMKRVHLALEALAELERRDLRLPLTIVGDGPERLNLEARAQALGIGSSVHFTGMVSPSEVGRRLAEMDVMLFPSRAEGFGLTAVEALATGVPVVACTDGGGVLDIVPEQGAGRRSAPSGEAIAGAVEQLMADKSAGAEAWRLGELWRRRLAPDTVAAAFEGWYAEALRA
ncbi:MAG TPA: glycosyltransferase [Gemmatimonadales bacterium]|nr:glycosyltransferase [Gemmatimonadales bacterium]